MVVKLIDCRSCELEKRSELEYRGSELERQEMLNREREARN